MLTIEIDRESDGRWIAEVLELPGVMAYGSTQREAITNAQALALRCLADRAEHGEAGDVVGQLLTDPFPACAGMNRTRA